MGNELNIKTIPISSPEYPNLLKQIYDPPSAIYVRGNLPPTWEASISIVGSRDCSLYGRQAANYFAEGLAKLGVTVVSGLAFGIDAHAHQKTLEVGGHTVAVLGTGADICYPKQHYGLFERIIENGAIISEFSIGTGARKENFPRRNRIIAGLTKGTLVIEAGEKSGSLITARFALNEGREVFAVPGSIYSKMSQGTHRLIQQGAKLVTSVDDILEEIAPHLIQQNVPPKSQFQNLDETERGVLQLLSHEPIQLENLIAKSSLELGSVYNALISLEIKGMVQELEGKQYLLK